MPVIRGRLKGGAAEGLPLGAVPRSVGVASYAKFPSSEESYGQVAHALQKFSLQMLDLRQNLNFYDIEKGQKAGKQNAGTTVENPDGTLTTIAPDPTANVQGNAQAYALASQDAYLAKSKQNIGETLSRFADKYATDPENYQKAVEAYGGELLAQASPAVRGALSEELDHYASKGQTYVAGRTLAQMDEAQEAAVDEQYISIQQRLEAATVNGDQAEVQRIMERDVPLFVESATGSKGSRPGWSPAKMISAMGKLERDIKKWSYFGEFKRGELDLAGFMSHQPKDLDTETWLSLRGTMNAEMAHGRALAAEGTKAEKALRKATLDHNYTIAAAYLRGAMAGEKDETGKPKEIWSPSTIASMEAHGEITGAAARALMAMTVEHQGKEDNPEFVAHVEGMISRGQDATATILANPGMLRNEKQSSLLAASAKVTRKHDPEYQKREWLKGVLAGGGIMRDLSGGQKAVMVNALSEYDSLREREPETDPEVHAMQTWAKYNDEIGPIMDIPGVSLPERYIPQMVDPDPAVVPEAQKQFIADVNSGLVDPEFAGEWAATQLGLIRGLRAKARMAKGSK